jgi:hypothetical protein
VSVFSVGNTLYTKGPLLDEGGGSGGFGLSNSYTPPSLSGYQPPYTLLDPGPSFRGGDGSFWADVQRFLQSLSSLIDPYILTEQERMQLEIQRRLAEAERARAEAEARRASVQVQPVVPAWVWVAVVGLGVVALVLLLKE